MPCEWKAGSTLLKATKDSAAFSVYPEGGTLHPNERANLEIKFTPGEIRKWNYAIPIRINKNPNARTINCKGDGVNFQLSFSPKTVELGPILPLAQEGVAVVKLVNHMPFPVDVYSIDFDRQYLDEEEVLRNAEGYVEDILSLPPREPGKVENI